MKTPRSYTQGYNVQAVVTEEQIVLAAEVSASSPDFGHLEPMVKATKRELQAIGVTETSRALDILARRCFIGSSRRSLAQEPTPARWQRRSAVLQRTPRP